MNEKELSKYSVKELFEIINRFESLNAKLSDNLKKSTDTMLKQAKEIESLKEQQDFCISEIHDKLNKPLEIKCSDKFGFECQINGKYVEKSDLYYICDYVRASDIAETLQDNYDIERTVSLKMGYHAVDLMDDKKISIEEAIEEVMSEAKQKEIDTLRDSLIEKYAELIEVCSEQELENELMFVNDVVENLKNSKGE